MSSPALRPSRGQVGVVTAVSGPTESAVAAALSGRRDLVLVRRCADVAELLSVTEAGLAVVAVLSEAFPGMDADVVDRVRLAGCAVVGVVDPDRESSERLRAWGVTVVDVDPAAAGGPLPGSSATASTGALLAEAVVLAAGEPRDASSSGTDGGTGAGPARPRPAHDGPRDGPRAGSPSSSHDGSPYVAGPDRAGNGGYSTPTGRGPTADDAGPRWGGRAEPHHPAAGDDAGPAGPGVGRGRLVAVWGPAGAPGRTTVAVSVAAELAADGAQVLLVDADTYAASIAQVLGMLDESPGLVAAVRAGLDGRLDPELLSRLAPTVSPGLRVLTGLTRAGRWSELRPAGLQAVWASARRLVDHVVVDLAPPLEEDEELSYDTAAPRRNGAALEALRAADDVLVVGSADPVGLQRLVRALQELAVAVPGAVPQVVVNRVRADSVGRNPRLRVREALDRFAGVSDPHLVPDDRSATDRALLAGRTLAEAAPDSPARTALRGAADVLALTAARETERAALRALGSDAEAATDGAGRPHPAGATGLGRAGALRRASPRRGRRRRSADGATGG